MSNRHRPEHPTVVVVEDETMVRELAVCELEEHGFAVVEFATADEALGYLCRHAATTSVIFTDVQMPGAVNGLQLTEIVSHRWPQIKVLVTSGGASVNLGILPACARFVPKPWRSADILSRIARLTGVDLGPGATPLAI